jgi:hypothetical protein
LSTSGGTSGSAFSLIQSQTIASGTTTAITFSNIPQTYTSLLLQAFLSTTYANTDQPVFYFNNDISNDYYLVGVYMTGTSVLGYGNNAAAGISPIVSDIPSGGAQKVPFKLFVPGYALTQDHPALLDHTWTSNMSHMGATWAPGTAAAITSIKVTLGSGSTFGASTASLYGLA